MSLPTIVVPALVLAVAGRLVRLTIRIIRIILIALIALVITYGARIARHPGRGSPPAAATQRHNPADR